MKDYDLNPGILIGAAALVISVFAAIVALYLWCVTRAKRKFDKVSDPQARAVIPWLSPLLLPTIIILCLGFVAGLWHAYEEKSWPKASSGILMAWGAFMLVMFWLKIRIHKLEFVEADVETT